MSNMNNYEPSIIAEKIKKECMRQSVTIKTMLKELNVNKDTIYKMSHGTAAAYTTIARICDYLHISIDTLLDRAATATTNATTTNADNAPPPVSIGQAVQVIADYMHTSSDYVRGALRLPPNDKNSTL